MPLLKKYRFDVDVLVDTEHKDAPTEQAILEQITEELAGPTSASAKEDYGIHEVNVRVRGTVRTDYGQE